MSDAEQPAPPSNWNLPNALTTLRMVLVPFFGWALLTDGGESVLWRCVAFAIFLFAMITDKVDGDIARKRNLVTNFGKIADPVADKAITGMAFIGLSIIGELWWWVTILVLLREWSVTIARISVLKYAVIAANAGGKIKTVLQTIALCAFTLPLRQFDGALGAVGEPLYWVGVAAMAAAVVATVVTGVDFFREAISQRRRGRASSDA